MAEANRLKYEYKDQIADLKDKLRNAENRLKDSTSTIIPYYHDNSLFNDRDVTGSNRNLNLTADIADKNRQIDELQKQLRDKDEKNLELTGVVEGNNQSSNELEARYKEKLNKLTENFNQLKNTNRNKKKEMRQQIDKKDEEIKSKSVKVKDLSQDINQLRKENIELKQELSKYFFL